MKQRVVVAVAAVALLGAWWVLRDRPVDPAPQTAREVAAEEEVVPLAERAPARGAPAPSPAPTRKEHREVVAALEGPATVVEIQPHDEVPEPPRDDGPEQPNDPIEPELPQTAAWKHGKTVHIAAALDRHVERIEARRLAAAQRGDDAEARRLQILVERQRKRLAAIREDAERLAAEAALEGGEELVAAP